MGTVSFRVTYVQGSDPATPGVITLHHPNGSESLTASGRLDHAGAMVFADNFSSVPNYEVSIECVQTSNSEMEVRLTFISGDATTVEYLEGPGGGEGQYGCSVIHRVLEHVPITFD